MKSVHCRQMSLSEMSPGALIERARTDPAVIGLPVVARLVWLLLVDLLNRSGGSLSVNLEPAAIAASIAVSSLDYISALGLLQDAGLVETNARGLIAKLPVRESPRSAANRENGRKGGLRHRQLAAERRAAAALAGAGT